LADVVTLQRRPPARTSDQDEEGFFVDALTGYEGVIAGAIGRLSAGISKPMRRKVHEMPRLVTDPQSHRRRRPRPTGTTPSGSPCAWARFITNVLSQSRRCSSEGFVFH
jgi:hypothetical protein